MMTCSCCGTTVPNAPFCCQCGASQKPITLGELHGNWKKIHYRRIGTKGIEGYETAWKALCVLKDKPVSALMLEDYQAVMDSIADYSYSKQQKLRQLISQLCQYAQMRKIDTSNYAPFLIYLLFRHPQCPFLITSPQGCRISLGNWRKRRFFPMMQELGINPVDNPHRIVPYCCRHTYASLAKRAGVDTGILAKMIGHADPKITEEVYIHETLDEMQSEVEKVNRLTSNITGVLTLSPQELAHGVA